jgi:hypothetical protein
MKQWILFVMLGTITLNARGQELEKAPKQYSFELGYRYMLRNELVADGGIHGFGFLLDYAWQLSGYLPGHNPIYLSVPLGYSMIPGGEGGTTQRMLHYGWTVRHMIGKPGAIHPFMGYALLLNQVTVADREGQLFGHQTRFAAGCNFNSAMRVIPYVAIEYSMSRHPQFNAPGSWLHFMELKTGIRL